MIKKSKDLEELLYLLSVAYKNNSKIKNKAIKKAYIFAENLSNRSDSEKIDDLLIMLQNENIYVRYWGAIIALSYNVLIKRALTCLIEILDMKNPVQEGAKLDLDLNMLKMDIESALYDYRKHKKIGSYPGQVNCTPSVLPNAKQAIKYFRRYLKLN